MGEPALTSSRPMGPMSPNGYAMTQTPLNPYTPNEPKWLRYGLSPMSASPGR
jgi:hypothetical protein